VWDFGNLQIFRKKFVVFYEWILAGHRRLPDSRQPPGWLCSDTRFTKSSVPIIYYELLDTGPTGRLVCDVSDGRTRFDIKLLSTAGPGLVSCSH
jgi:hypothetical protein